MPAQEYRETTLNAAVDALYSEMASRHRVRAPCIFVSTHRSYISHYANCQLLRSTLGGSSVCVCWQQSQLQQCAVHLRHQAGFSAHMIGSSQQLR